MTTRIITDSSANFYDKDIDGVEHISVPLSLRVDDKEWVDDENLDLAAFQAALKATDDKSTSSCPNLNAWLDAYRGADEIFVITITSALSGSYNAAVQAAKIYHEEDPSAKILVFDSRSAGPQLQLLARKIASLVNKGFTFEEIVKEAENYQHHIALIFALKDLTNLANNGRVSNTVAKMAGLLRLNIIGNANNKGEFELAGKARGVKKAQTKMLSDMIKNGYIGGEVQIDQVNNLEGAEAFKQVILNKFPEADVHIGECGGLCSYYGEEGGLMVGYEK